MKYMVRKSIVQVLGYLWMSAKATYEYTLSPHDVENAKDGNGKLTRESVQLWLDSHAGDFHSVIDWHASLEDGSETVEIPWQSEENELTYTDITYPCE